MAKKQKASSQTKLVQKFYPPVVAVLGHVDHGKTTLLDAIRKTDVAAKEHGGITQKIGASSVEITHDGVKRKITFIDTPGHEAFFAMRSRGATAADIGLLVVSSIDGVMPQTKESIKLLEDSKTPFIVVLTKSDSPNKNSEKVKQQLLKEKIELEGYGGSVPVIEVSAKENKNIKELLELILLVLDMQENKGESLSEKAPLEAIVIESKLDLQIGPKATVVIKNGSLVIRDELSCDGVLSRVRTVITSSGEHIKEATIGDAVELLGFSKVPPVGSVVYKKGEAPEEKKLTSEPIADAGPLMPPTFEAERASVSLILCADTLGSLEAIVDAFPKDIKIISKKTGEFTPADVLLAKSTGSLLIGFNTRIRGEVARQAMQEKVLLKNYPIIYELIDEISDLLEGKQLSMLEKVFGKAKVLASFPYEKTKVLGVMVLEGRVAKGDKARIMRGEDIIGESYISSVRQGKNQISKVEKGNEAGIIIAPFLDFTIGDVVICYG